MKEQINMFHFMAMLFILQANLILTKIIYIYSIWQHNGGKGREMMGQGEIFLNLDPNKGITFI
jgi:hypothetical protein